MTLSVKTSFCIKVKSNGFLHLCFGTQLIESTIRVISRIFALWKLLFVFEKIIKKSYFLLQMYEIPISELSLMYVKIYFSVIFQNITLPYINYQRFNYTD